MHTPFFSLARQSMTSRSYCFTLNNYTDDEQTRLSTSVEDSRVRYLCYQQELGNIPHLQGYVEFRSPTRIAGAKTLLGTPRVHLEPRRGTRDQAREYCRKHDTAVPGSFRDYGIWDTGGQGVRSDLAVVAALVLDGVPDASIARGHPAVFVRYHRGLHALRTAVSPSVVRGSPTTLVLWGNTGSGKSKHVHENYPDAYWWPRPQNSGQYAYGYTGQETIVFDDFYGWLPYSLLLRIVDRYPLTLNTQGGNIPCQASTFVFTSNQPPHCWYAESTALLRRLREFGEITEMNTSAS